jgi:hypothetical protein
MPIQCWRPQIVFFLVGGYRKNATLRFVAAQQRSSFGMGFIKPKDAAAVRSDAHDDVVLENPGNSGLGSLAFLLTLSKSRYHSCDRSLGSPYSENIANGPTP